MSLGDQIAAASLVASIFTALATVSIAILTLRYTASPNIDVGLVGSPDVMAGETFSMQFEIQNIGYWFGTPAARDISAYVNCPPTFELNQLSFGSGLQIKDTSVKIGKENKIYLKAHGIMIGSRRAGEAIELTALAPKMPGFYSVHIALSSGEGANRDRDFTVRVLA